MIKEQTADQAIKVYLNLPKFEEVGQLLIQVPLSYLDERSGTEETLRFHHGTNHVLINAAVQS